MKQIGFKSFFVIVFILQLFTAGANAQIVMDAFQVQPSTLFEDILKLRSKEPKMAPNQLAEQANALLLKSGVDFIFAFDQDTCQKIRNAQENLKDKAKPLKLNATLKSVNAESAKIALPEISFDKSECGKCFVRLPVFELTGKTFVTSVQGINIKFYTPDNFFFNEVSLFDLKTSASTKTWFVPFRANPIGVSDDNKLLYLQLPYAELSEFALIVFDEGAFQFYPKSELDLTPKLVKPKDVPAKDILPNTSFVNVVKGDRIQTLKYNTPCQ